MFAASLRDITDQQNADEAIRESEERYRQLFENANDIIYTHDLQGNFTSLNRNGERNHGLLARRDYDDERRRCDRA